MCCNGGSLLKNSVRISRVIRITAIPGQASRDVPAHPVIGLHRIHQREQHAVDALANGHPELSESRLVVAGRQGLAQRSERVLQPDKEFLTIPHRIVALDTVHGMKCLKVVEERPQGQHGTASRLCREIF